MECKKNNSIINDYMIQQSSYYTYVLYELDLIVLYYNIVSGINAFHYAIQNCKPFCEPIRNI